MKFLIQLYILKPVKKRYFLLKYEFRQLDTGYCSLLTSIFFKGKERWRCPRFPYLLLSSLVCMQKARWPIDFILNNWLLPSYANSQRHATVKTRTNLYARMHFSKHHSTSFFFFKNLVVFFNLYLSWCVGFLSFY